MNSVVLIFIDGLGIGDRDPANPLYTVRGLAPIAHFRDSSTDVPPGGILVPTDPRLGVEGRPQSASGQTTILTGINAPKLLGYHKQGFPNQALRELIRIESIFLKLTALDIQPNVFVNVYPPQFFQEPPRWKSATTCAVEAARLSFRKLPDLVGGHALSHDFTNSVLLERGFDVPLFSPEESGAILARLAARHRFTLYEHFLTDSIGHSRDLAAAERHLPKLAAFVNAVLANVDLDATTVILTSDHGNIEDLSIRNHTLNDVPTVIWGRNKQQAALSIRDLADLTPAIIGLLTDS